jgi:alpha-galactosidase
MGRFGQRFAWVASVLILLATLGSPQGTRAGEEPKLALTPPMGWNSWNHFGCKVTDAVVRAAADAMVSTGMKDVGYQYVNIDDCWQGTRDAEGNIRGNERFPDMKALADYVHSKGLKFGLYSSPGPKTCAGFEGSYGHEEQDARTYAQWGVDFLKYDWCSGDQVYRQNEADTKAAYQKMHEALQSTGRPIVFSLCYSAYRVWRWGASVGGNLWRTTGDITDDYNQMWINGTQQNGLEKYAGPGHWNDPDMLEIGNQKLTEYEPRTQMSLWSILAAPLIAGNDLTTMTKETLAALTNPDVIAVDQDPAGIQGQRISQEGPLEVWMKPLADGSKAVGLFNSGNYDMQVTADFSQMGISGPASVRVLWPRRQLGHFRSSFTAIVPRHGAVMIGVSTKQ